MPEGEKGRAVEARPHHVRMHRAQGTTSSWRPGPDCHPSVQQPHLATSLARVFADDLVTPGDPKSINCFWNAIVELTFRQQSEDRRGHAGQNDDADDPSYYPDDGLVLNRQKRCRSDE